MGRSEYYYHEIPHLYCGWVYTSAVLLTRDDMVARVLNKHFHAIPRDAVYVGRGSPFGNPFRIGVDGRRDQVIAKFERWLETQPELIEKIKRELRGKDLVCFCAPSYCHAEILMEIANGT